MSDYLRLRTLVEISEHSDYHQASQGEMEYTATPDEWEGPAKVDALTTGTTVELGNYTSVTVILVENTDATNFVVATHTYAAASAAVYIPAGGFIAIYSPTVANDLLLTADTATCTCKVWIAGT